MGAAFQVLREIDKADKIGRDGVFAMLTTGRTDASGAFVKGVGMQPFQAEFICSAVFGGGLDHTARIVLRVDLMAALDRGDGETAWDRLLSMPANDDETWRNGGRPRNIGWALDDIVAAIAKAEGR